MAHTVPARVQATKGRRDMGTGKTVRLQASTLHETAASDHKPGCSTSSEKNNLQIVRKRYVYIPFPHPHRSPPKSRHDGMLRSTPCMFMLAVSTATFVLGLIALVLEMSLAFQNFARKLRSPSSLLWSTHRTNIPAHRICDATTSGNGFMTPIILYMSFSYRRY